MAESKQFGIEGPLAIAGFVCGLTGCGLGVPLAITAFVCALTSCAFGLMPTLASPALVLGVVGAAFGFISRKGSPSGGTQGRLALSAVILGCVATGLATIGFVIVNS
jgi:hypothetical protein